MKNTLVVLVLFLARAALASDEVVQTVEEPARDYAHGSVSVLGSASIGVGLAGASASGSAFQLIGVNAGVAVRFVTKPGFTLEPRIGLDGAMLTGNAGLYAVLAARAGIGAGWAFRLGRRVALTPMLAYEAAYVGGGIAAGLSGLVHTGAVELPLTVFFTEKSFVEVYARGGVTSLLGQATPAFAAGYRFGMVW